MRCDQCEAALVTYCGETAFCHERGCPNERKTYRYGAWILILDCDVCGCEVEAGAMCGCCEETGAEPEEISIEEQR
jgi:hypothetical protein